MTDTDTETGAVVLVSGGIDSAVCLEEAWQMADVVQPLYFDYGQTSDEEKAATLVTRWFQGRGDGVVRPLETIDYRSVFDEFQTGLTADSRGPAPAEDMNDAYVPMRNLHFLATAGALAWRNEMDSVWFGAQGGEGDMQINPDARPVFVHAARAAINHSIEEGATIDVVAPFQTASKAEVVARGLERGIPFERTWSCYDGERPEPCQDCDACEERTAAFEANDEVDPLLV